MVKDQPFEPPVLRELGTFHELTLQNKFFNSADGFTVAGQPVGNTSG